MTPCAVCGRRGWDEWAVSDEEWKRYVPLEYQDKEICRVCYERFKRIRGVKHYIGGQIPAGPWMPRSSGKEAFGLIDKVRRNIHLLLGGSPSYQEIVYKYKVFRLFGDFGPEDLVFDTEEEAEKWIAGVKAYRPELDFEVKKVAGRYVRKWERVGIFTGRAAKVWVWEPL